PLLGAHALPRATHLPVAHPAHRHAQLPAAEALDALQGLALRARLRDDPLARAAVADAVRRAEPVQQLLAAHAQPRLEARGPVVDALVDAFAVARARLRAYAAVPLQQQRRRGGRRRWARRAVAEGELSRDGEPDD